MKCNESRCRGGKEEAAVGVVLEGGCTTPSSKRPVGPDGPRSWGVLPRVQGDGTRVGRFGEQKWPGGRPGGRAVDPTYQWGEATADAMAGVGSTQEGPSRVARKR